MKNIRVEIDSLIVIKSTPRTKELGIADLQASVRQVGDKIIYAILADPLLEQFKGPYRLKHDEYLIVNESVGEPVVA